MRAQTLFAFLSVVLTATASQAEPPDERPGRGQHVYALVEPMVFKVKTAPNADSPKASYGTGFAVAADGLLITNYHVVSEAVLNPRLHKIFLVVGEESRPARILGVDVSQDLALIKVDRKFEKWLRFARRPLRQGEAIYSVGEPEDLNMAIVVGTYNNELKYGPYSVIHMSSPINSGMSGGPTVDSRGEIVGINVSKRVSSDSLSFAVPARFAEALIARARSREAPTNDELISEMTGQLTAIQDNLTEEFLSSPSSKKTVSLDTWMFAQPPTSLKCWSQKTEDEEDGKYEWLWQNCQLPHTSYIDAGLDIGYYSIETKALFARSLRAMPFYALLGSHFAQGFDSNGLRFFFNDTNARLLTRQFCFSEIVTNTSGLNLKVVYCTRGYVKFKGLREATVSVISIAPPPHGFVAELLLNGFTTANVRKIVESFIDQVRMAKP